MNMPVIAIRRSGRTESVTEPLDTAAADEALCWWELFPRPEEILELASTLITCYLDGMRSHQVELAGLNIALPNHGIGGTRYVELFKAGFELAKSVKIHGSTHAMIGTMAEIVKGVPEEGLEGEILRYVVIDMKDPWVDFATRKVIEAEDAKLQVNFPSTWGANGESVRYIFFPKVHRIVFVSDSPKGSLSPMQAEKLFTAVLKDNSLHSQFPNVELTILQSKEALVEIFKTVGIETLTIVIKRPNSDGGEEDDITIEQVLDEQNAREQITEIKSQSNAFITPNSKTLQLAELATTNGHVRVKGKNFETSKRVVEDTIKHPLKEKFPFDHSQSTIAWLRDKAAIFGKKFKE